MPEEIQPFVQRLELFYPVSVIETHRMMVPGYEFIAWADRNDAKWALLLPRKVGCSIVLLDDAILALYQLTYENA